MIVGIPKKDLDDPVDGSEIQLSPFELGSLSAFIPFFTSYRVDQLPLFPYNRGWSTHQPNSIGIYIIPIIRISVNRWLLGISEQSTVGIAGDSLNLP